MSLDGCLEVAWKGQAFPYLMHHPKNPLQTDSYGSHRSERRRPRLGRPCSGARRAGAPLLLAARS
jgi:hypothetical protein